MRQEPVDRIHERLRRDLGGPATPVDPVVDPAELDSMQKRLWGPMARAAQQRVWVEPRWDEYSLQRRLRFEPAARRYTRSLIDTFWAGYPAAERDGMQKDVLETYLDPAKQTQKMPFSLAFLLHQAVHLITSNEEFTARLVSHLIAAHSIEAFRGARVPKSWEDPVEREVFPWWGRLMERDYDLWPLVKHLRGNRIYHWLGARIFALHQEGRPLAGRFGDLYLFFRSHLPPTGAHLRWIDEAVSALPNLRAPGDLRPVESAEVEETWAAIPGGVEALKRGAIELMRQGGFVTDLYFRAATDLTWRERKGW